MEEGTEERERKKMRALTELANWLATIGWRSLVANAGDNSGLRSLANWLLASPICDPVFVAC